MTSYGPSHPSDDSATTTPRQRKRSKWDQATPSLSSAGLTNPIVGPSSNGAATIADMALLGGVQFVNALPAMGLSVSQVIQAPLVHQSASSLVQKINQNKIQDELIAREIVINDAEPAIRCKLTKRQTQEEIQRTTGAIVITRGKYIPPSAQPTIEKPLYLHISAASHLKDMVERIKAVDHAALMVEDIIRQGVCQSQHQGSTALTACLYLGFEPNSSVNIEARIRGPNDQFINHIINETGANVVLRGRGSDNANGDDEDGLQPLHLFLSSHNFKSLESAKLLAANLLDTISAECGASRASTSKVYGAVPPPQQLLDGIQNTSTVLSAGPPANNPVSTNHPSSVPDTRQSLPDLACHHHFSGLGATSYNGYGGIYPQATPLQQVALALRKSVPPAATVPISTSLHGIIAIQPLNTNACTAQMNEAEKRPAPKRKFQELPKAPKSVSENLPSRSEFVKPGFTVKDSIRRDFSLMPPPKMLLQSGSSEMPPPISMPPPPPKFTTQPKVEDKMMPAEKAPIIASVPDTLAKLVEYGGDEDDDAEETLITQRRQQSVPKPFWAV